VVRLAGVSRPEPVLRSYLSFCEIRQRYKTTGKLVVDTDFVFPTTLLPLAVLAAQSGRRVAASYPAVRGYVDWITHADDPPKGGTYVPVVRLPSNPQAHVEVLKHLEDLSVTTHLFSANRDAYHYLLSELIDNIYEHAGASRAYVMAQCYPKKGLIEASFMDDGVSIPKSLERGRGVSYAPDRAHRAILDALGGASAKSRDERGYGLRSSVRVVNALGGVVLIVSGRGAVVAREDGGNSVYRLSPQNQLDGTLVSIQLSNSSKRINLYEQLEG
jgi:anti-sigma regulatory factor (Ser/Thr protein kinase)